MRQSDLFVLLDSVQFRKNYFQNRNRIRTAAGWDWLTVPVLTSGEASQSIVEVRIRNDRAWRRKHRDALRQHYGRAPFFAAHFPQLDAIYEREWEGLVDFNLAVIDWLLGAVGLHKKLVRSSTLAVGGSRSQLLANICEVVGAEAYLSGVSGRDYLDESRFHARGIAVRYQEFHHPVYRQCYAPFVPEMSAVDLLFNLGPASLATLGEAQPQVELA